MADNDPFAKVNKGDRFQFKAAVYNAIVDLINENRLPGLRGAEFIPGAKEDETSVLVKNKSGADIPQFGIVAISKPAILQSANDQAFRQRHLWEAGAPSADATVGIVQEPLAAGPGGDQTNGSMGRAVIMGETPCKINVTNSSHKFAKPSTSTSTLDSSEAGAIKILWYDQTGGATGNNKWAKVLIGLAGTTPNCGKTIKRYGQVFSNAGSDYQDFTVEDCCCNVIASGCEVKPSRVCAGVPTNSCKCVGTSPNFWTFTLSGFTNGTCNGCTQWNRNFCLSRFLPTSDPQYDCMFAAQYPVTVPCSGYGAGGMGIAAVIKISPDGSATLQLTATGSGPGGQRIYYLSSWNCNAANTFSTILSDQVAGTCNGWPSSITVYPSSTDSLCTNPPGGGHDCAACAAATWTATGGTVTNGTCTGCSAVATSITLSLTTTCNYESTLVSEPSITCPGPSVQSVHYQLFDNGATGWDLFISASSGMLARYFLAYAAWNCGIGQPNVMNIVGGSGAQCNMPSTWTVTKAS